MTGGGNMDRMEMLKAFDETKTGVKGLLDSGLVELPKIFVRPSDELTKEQKHKICHVQIPVIDLSGIRNPRNRKQIVDQVRNASEIWGFFQVVNHGIPSGILEGMIDSAREFMEGDIEEKKKYYKREFGRSVKFISNNDLYTSTTANWRDTLSMSITDQTDADDLPVSCRESAVEYTKQVKVLGNTLLELFSEALGLEPDYLINNLECSKGHRLACHYYPACPQPELAIGIVKHSDPVFLTILLQNHISGLQVLHQDEWIDVKPTPQAFVVNIGDLFQLVTNGKFKSIQHRVVANRLGPRISIASFLMGPLDQVDRTYGPIKDLVSEENPALYRDILLSDYRNRFFGVALDRTTGLDGYKL